MTAADYADAVSRAVRTLCRHMDDASPDRSLKAATEVIQLECHRLCHGRDIIGTTPWESGSPGGGQLSLSSLGARTSRPPGICRPGPSTRTENFLTLTASADETATLPGKTSSPTSTWTYSPTR